MILTLVVATVAAFVISGAYYAIASAAGVFHPASGSAPSGAKLAVVELTRSAAIAALVVGILHRADWTTLSEGALLGLALWTLPVVLLAGSVFHEQANVRTAGVHAGDWLIKLVAIGAIAGALA